MSYIQVEIGGKKRGLKFNTLAIREFLTKLDPERFGLTANYAMVWAGLYANCYVKQQELDFTFEDVCEWTDKLTQSTVDEISLVMASVEEYKRLLPETEKKNKPSKKSKNT